MKTLKQAFAPSLILSIASISAILYLDQFYNISAGLTLIWIVGAAHWIKEKATQIKISK
jgi:hypothetical protein